jgi:TRAP-type mannitol/chloroaromatic compound transport system permease small subunit
MILGLVSSNQKVKRNDEFYSRAQIEKRNFIFLWVVLLGLGYCFSDNDQDHDHASIWGEFLVQAF